MHGTSLIAIRIAQVSQDVTAGVHAALGGAGAKTKATSDSLWWAKLLKRVINLDLEHCPSCDGELKVIAAILERPALEKILTHLGLDA